MAKTTRPAGLERGPKTMADETKAVPAWPLDHVPPPFGRPVHFTAVDSMRLLGDPTKTFTGQAVSLFSNHVLTKLPLPGAE